MKKREAAFQVRFGKWVVSPEARAFVGRSSFAFELKRVEAGRAMAWTAVAEHQVEALRRARGTSEYGRVLYHKISDMGAGFKPCDGFVIGGGGGWLFVEWDGGEGFYMVDVEEWVDMAAAARAGRGRRGGFTEALARERGTWIPWKQPSPV